MSLLVEKFAEGANHDKLLAVETSYIGKTGKVLDPNHTPIIFGAGLMILGILGLLAGVVQYGRILRRLKSEQYTYFEPYPLPEIMAVLLIVIGIFGIWTILF